MSEVEMQESTPLQGKVHSEEDPQEEMLYPLHFDTEKTLEVLLVDDDQKKPLPAKDQIDAAQLLFDDHVVSLDELAERYSTRFDRDFPEKSQGLSTEEHKNRLLRDGPNKLAEAQKEWMILQYLQQFRNPLTALLLISAVLSIILYFLDSSSLTNLYLGIILLCVTVINTMIEFVQGQRGQRALSAFKNLIPSNTLVIRDGHAHQGQAVDLVVGDVVQLREGEKVAADVRLFWVHHNMKVDNSSITGESEPQHRSLDNDEKNALEAKNMCFSGTLVSSGFGYGVVVRTGNDTMLGQIAKMTSGYHDLKNVDIKKNKRSPLEQEMDSFVWIISVFAVAMSLAFFTAGMIINPNFATNFTFLVGILVANVPQGLPSTVTLLLTYAVVKLSKENVLVKDLQGIDTLGSITLLASDKTGTMTQNRMTVVQLWLKGKILNSHAHQRSSIDEKEQSEEKFEYTDTESRMVVELSCLCSRARFEASDDPIDKRNVLGDATEAGLLRFAAFHEDVDLLHEKYPTVFEMPFNTHTKWALTIHPLSIEEDPEHSFILYMKGAPERVFSRCTEIVSETGIRPLTEEDERDFNRSYEKLASSGERVLSFAFKKLLRKDYPSEYKFKADPSENFPVHDFSFLCLTGLMDPPKPGVANAIRNCRSAGIKVMMLTGDHPLTAEAIARQVGLITGETREAAAMRLGIEPEFVPESEYTSAVVHGDLLGGFTNAEWERVLSKAEVVFARMTPLHKLEIVARCQALGHVVAVTGDGVNDAPALKIADLGISMGISGSDVSKEAAKMILLDDNFVTVVHGIQQGRLIFANLKKSIQYTLTHIWPEIVPFLLFIVAGLPPALSSILILMFDCCTELPPAISLAWEPAESDLMKRPPRKQVLPKTISVPADCASSLSRVPSIVLKQAHVELESSNKKKWYSGLLPKSVKRNKGDERLVDWKLLIWSYVFAGNVEAIGCLFAFFVVMVNGGIPFSELWGLGRTAFKSMPPTDAIINGQFYSSAELESLLFTANAAYFVTMIIIQFGTLFTVKTLNEIPSLSKLFMNWRSLVAIAVSFGISAVIVYIPGLQGFFGTGNFDGLVYPVAFGFAVLLFVLEMSRRGLVKLRGTFFNPEHNLKSKEEAVLEAF